MSSRIFVGTITFVLSLSLLFSVAHASEETVVERGDTATQGPALDRLGVETPSRRARSELAAFQSSHGLVLGIQTCVLIECEPGEGFLLASLGATLGLSASLGLVDSSRLHPGATSAINSATIWGGWIGLASANITELSGSPRLRLTMLGQLAGLGSGALLASSLRPNAGDVRLVDTTAGWAIGFYAALAWGIFGDQRSGISTQQLFSELLGVSLGGGIAGAIYARNRPMSEGRVALISTGGIVGGLLGLGSAFIIFDDDVTRRRGWAFSTAGAAAGLVTGGILTTDWDDEDAFQRASTDFSVMPTSEFDGVQATLSGRF